MRNNLTYWINYIFTKVIEIFEYIYIYFSFNALSLL